MTGPHMLAKVAYDEHYGDIAKMMADLSKLLRHNFKLLAAAGCKNIQIDEPLFTMSDDKEVQAAVDAINGAIEGLPGDVHVSTHICQGNYAVGKEYDAQIGHRYFDTGRYKADLVCKIECSSYLIEHDMTHHYEGLLGNRQLGVGAVDVQDPKVESGETVASRIRAHKWLAPDQTIVTSSCGFNHLPRQIALGKLHAMTDAKRSSRRVVLCRITRRSTILKAPSYCCWPKRRPHRGNRLARSGRHGAPFARALELYGITQFDGRYDSWISTVHREDHRKTARRHGHGV